MFSSLAWKCWTWRKRFRRIHRPYEPFGLLREPHAECVLTCFYQYTHPPWGQEKWEETASQQWDMKGVGAGLGALRWDTWDSDGSKGWSEGWKQGEWLWSVPKRQGKKKKNKQHLYSLMGESRITVIVWSRQEIGERNRTILPMLYFRIWGTREMRLGELKKGIKENMDGEERGKKWSKEG